MNAYQWWAPALSVSQNIDYIPSGEYELSAVVATWTGRNVYFRGNDDIVTVDGRGDVTGIQVSMPITIDQSQKLYIEAGSTAQWWVEGHEGETQTFFKLDNVRLKCKTIYVDGMAQPLPNDGETILKANQWYYYESTFGQDYWLVGPLENILYTTDGLVDPEAARLTTAPKRLTLPVGRVYFKTSSSRATLQVVPACEIVTGTFTAVALNVDGLPQRIATVELNADGPGSDGTRKISRYLAGKDYDIIGVSEDFNYHGSLMSELNGYNSGTVRATLSIDDLPWSQMIKLSFRFDTDGLNLIWRDQTVAAGGESWTQWSSMEATDGNQYVRKGFRHYDVTFGDGALVDVYILHMDAGGTQSTASRESQWRQLAEAINNADPSRPKLIIGDTNSRWTRENIIANFINILRPELHAEDVWVEKFRGGVYPNVDMDDLTDQSDPANLSQYEIVDKIIYINSSLMGATQLTPQSFHIEQDYTYGNIDGTDDTKPLGDHRPVVVTFGYTRAGEQIPEPFYDAVSDLKTESSESAAIYNLAGQKVGTAAASPTNIPQGVYVIGNRKVAVTRSR